MGTLPTDLFLPVIPGNEQVAGEWEAKRRPPGSINDPLSDDKSATGVPFFLTICIYIISAQIGRRQAKRSITFFAPLGYKFVP